MGGTVRKVAVGSGLLIFAYLALVHFTGFSADVNSTANGSANVIKSLQGR